MEDQFVAFGVALLYLRRRRRRSVWVHEILQACQQLGEYHRLVQELRLDDGRFLATGDSYRTIAFSYRVGVSTMAGIVGEVARAIWDALVQEVMPVPTTEDWRSIATDFLHRWNFPNCLGSIDGKHVVIRAPDNSGSLFFNYKGTYSVVLLAVVDAQYCFRVVDVGSYGRTSDGGVMADEAFPLRRDLMRPFPGHKLSSRQRIFNYRLSRARLIVENAFGILTAQWRMYRGVIEISPANMMTFIHSA
ncbi:hypothetical protein M9458_055850 [Cirrhinus mrigala]|uniref:DDE Tnp4 domain-containing protein n=1 Tax=Cirrhinus mrigala TaxID=683832 RepID=A0ABD0MJ40_CIRMR